MDVAILRPIANPAILHETVLIGLFSAPYFHETAPSRLSIDQRALMLGPFRPNYLPSLVTRSAFERLVLVTEVGFPFLPAPAWWVAGNCRQQSDAARSSLWWFGWLPPLPRAGQRPQCE